MNGLARRRYGQAIEQEAKVYISHCFPSWIYLEENYSCKGGEIDLIYKDDRCLVFIEVRMRRGQGMQTALESIDSKKLMRLQKTIKVYLYKESLKIREFQMDELRLDVLTFDGMSWGYFKSVSLV